MGERTFPRTREDTSLDTASLSLDRSACSTATAWYCTMPFLLWTTSWISLVHRFTVSMFSASRCMALTSTALATGALLSTTA